MFRGGSIKNIFGAMPHPTKLKERESRSPVGHSLPSRLGDGWRRFLKATERSFLHLRICIYRCLELVEQCFMSHLGVMPRFPRPHVALPLNMLQLAYLRQCMKLLYNYTQQHKVLLLKCVFVLSYSSEIVCYLLIASTNKLINIMICTVIKKKQVAFQRSYS